MNCTPITARPGWRRWMPCWQPAIRTFCQQQLQAESGLRPNRVEEVYLFGTDQRDIWVDVTATFKRKMVAITCRASQLVGLRDLALKMSYCKQGYAQEHGVTCVEVFKALHPFCDT
jgi:hypothetical protein